MHNKVINCAMLVGLSMSFLLRTSTRVGDADSLGRGSVYSKLAPLNAAAYFWDFLPFPAPVVEVSSVFADIVRVRPPM